MLPIFRGGSVEESPWPTKPTRAPDFWQLDKTGSHVLTSVRAQVAQSTTDHAAAQRPTVEQQHERGL